MSSKFVALPVAAGDAFLLEKNNKVILFDGGKSSKELPQLVSSLKYKKINIAVCSHNDSDHANGIIGLLKSNIKCDEIWLPGSWSKRLKDLLCNPFEFYEELYKECLNENTLASSLEEFEDTSTNDEFHPEDLEDLEIESIEVLDRVPDKLLVRHIWWLYHAIPNDIKSLSNHKLLIDAIEATTRIREIAILAKERKVRIRWFEFTDLPHETPTGGEPNFLIPLNAKELKKPNVNQMNILKYLSLSMSNKKSLVFYSPASTSNQDGVLFTADSDLATIQTKQFSQKPTLITIPHHGSDANHSAYQKFINPDNLYVRSDGCYQSRPGRKYKQLPLDKRFCTRCNCTKQGMSVIFTQTKSSWSTNNPHCSC